MHHMLTLAALGLWVTTSFAQVPDVPDRFNVRADPRNYPQNTPKETLNSALEAIERNRFDYMLAHLTDPKLVEAYMKDHKVTFEEMVKEVRRKMNEDQDSLKELRKLYREGETKIDGDSAKITHKDITGRSVFLVKKDNRWFLENRKE